MTLRNNMDSWSDARLVQEYRNGNSQAFSGIVKRYEKNIIRYIRTFIEDEDAAKDVMQDTWVALMAAINNEKYREKELFEWFLRRMARNQALKALRDEHPEKFVSAETGDLVADDAKNPEEYALSREKAIQLGRIIKLLLGRQEAKVFILYAFRGKSFREIAQRLGIREDSARSIYAAAKHKILRWTGDGKI